MSYYGGAYASGPGTGPAGPQIRPLWMDMPQSVWDMFANVQVSPQVAHLLDGLAPGVPQAGMGQAGMAQPGTPQASMPQASMPQGAFAPAGVNPMGVSPMGVSPMSAGPAVAGPAAGSSAPVIPLASDEWFRQHAAATLISCYRWLEQAVPLQPALASLVPPLVAAVQLYSAQQYESSLRHATTVVTAIGNARTAMPSLPAL